MATPKTRRTPSKKAPAPVAPPPTPKKSKVPFVLFSLLGVGLLALLVWAVLHRADTGPKVPLPRVLDGFTLGSSYLEAKGRYAKLELRNYNDDPDFRIANLKAADGLPAGITGADLIYHKNVLFFVSVQWNTPQDARDLDNTARQFRRWMNPGGGATQAMGENATLREWNFRDDATEMILRELKYNERKEFWQDLRDRTNAEALAAFEKYRIDA